jgi:hypothetical protein
MPQLPLQLLRIRSLGIIAFATVLLFPSSSTDAQTAKAARTPVLVELFTSEGCSSCPPADAVLAALDREQPVPSADIIVLGEHVDYWDGLGWHDRFSSHQFTDRQSQYARGLHLDSNYTPQMIVDGTDQFVGNDGPHALRAVQHAAQTPKLQLTLTHPMVDGHRISASVSVTAPTDQQKGDLYAALVDPADTTEVRGGENGGRELHHVGVVRVLQRIGTLKDAGTPHEFSLNAPADAVPARMRVVVFAQRGGQGPILGAATANTTEAATAAAIESAPRLVPRP